MSGYDQIRAQLRIAIDKAFTPDPASTGWRVDADHVKTLVETLIALDVAENVMQP